MAAAKYPKLLEEFSKLTDKIVDRASKETLEKAKEEAAKTFLDKEKLYSEAVGVSAEIPIKLDASGNSYDVGELNMELDKFGNGLADATKLELKEQLTKKYGEDFCRL